MPETYLGSLCKQGHDHQGSGKSLRSTTRGECVQCRKLAGQRYVKNNRAKHNKSTAAWAKQRRTTDPYAMWCIALKARCKAAGVSYDLTPDFLKGLFEKQGGMCYWLGIEISTSLPTMHPAKATVDRLRPKDGYTQDNVVWASGFANRGRIDLPESEFREFLGKVQDGLRKVGRYGLLR